MERPPNAPRLDPARKCIRWDGQLDRDGYGRWGNGSAGSQQAHRRVWEEDVGDIPEGMTLDHACHTFTGCTLTKDCPHRQCIALYHLDLVPWAENSRRRWGRIDKPSGRS